MRQRMGNAAAENGVACHGAIHAMPLSIVLMAAGGAMNMGGADLKRGRYLAAECLTCHRTATETGTIPNIFGMPAPSFTALIKAYRSKQRPNPVMQTVASRLTDEEIDALAAYFARTREGKP